MTLALILALGFPHEITIDAGRVTPISPYIYGVNYPDTSITDWLKEWETYHDGFTLAREGGNRFTAYNWETNASNAGNDYYHENDDYLGTSNEPGWTVSQFLKVVQGARAAALLTVPTLGYVSADKTAEMNGSRDVGKTPDYLNVRFNRSYPSKPGRRPSYPPDLTDHAVYQDEFVAWVESVKSPNSPVWFSLDNEPDLWDQTHARIHPTKLTYADLIANNLAYAQMIKSVAPSALVFGPANFGWSGFRNLRDATDANGRIFTDAYLDGMREAGEREHRRLLDVYDFHWYPEATGDGVRITFSSAPDKPATGPARIEAPRSLWDPTYVEDSWIPRNLGGKPIMLLPDMSARIAKHYPGTKMAITEYDFGGRNTISGALAQADALGVFGRYGLFAACHWGLNHTEKPAYAGFEAFTNFDRKGARFGDRGLAVTGETPQDNSVYAALDSRDSRRLTIVAINKTTSPQPIHLVVKGFKPDSTRSFVVETGAFDEPHAGMVSSLSQALDLTLPPLSITSVDARRRG